MWGDWPGGHPGRAPRRAGASAGSGGTRGAQGCPLADEGRGALLTSYFWRFSFSAYSNLLVSSWYRVSQSSLALSLGRERQRGRAGRSAPGGWGRAPPHPEGRPHVSFSSLRWSMLRGFRRSARTFFFISRAVCFLPLFWSA